MNNRDIITILLVAVVSASCAPAAPRADNFAFVFQDTPCGPTPVYTLDTASGTLVYTPLTETTSITISLRLTDDELEAIYQKAISIGFFDYPTNFAIPGDQARGIITPAATYRLGMTNGDRSNTVNWTDGVIADPGYKKGDRLRELMILINETIQSHPEMKQLPKPKAGCA